MEVSCFACGKTLLRWKSHVRSKVFCNMECRKAFHKSHLVCEGCGVSFVGTPTQKTKKYCTWECFKRSRWKEVTCVWCGKIFEKRISEIKKAEKTGGKDICSISCRNSFTSKLLGGSGDWTPGGKYRKYGDRKSWRNSRNLAINRDEFTCQQCGSQDQLEVHHWEPYELSFDNSADNLVTLCKLCHQDLHKSYIKEGFYEDFYSECQ